MTKRKSPGDKPRSSSAAAATETDTRSGSALPADAVARHMPSSVAIRETIESVVIAIVLAFLFRTFEAEAFVIPTGSMAPTLMGRHKDVVCPTCGASYQVGASEEVDVNGAANKDRFGKDVQTVAGTCPMCRYTADLGPDKKGREKYPSYSGDRILVSKFAYGVAEPQRWDVVVFKFPGDATNDARTNFIKRLVGLPGETIRIQHGDIWVRKGEEPFNIARKPPEKLLAMLQPVFDNDYMARIAEYGWPARWKPEPSAEDAWSSDDHTTFRTDGMATDERWLRYSNRVPTYQQWQTEQKQSGPAPQNTAPSLITDFTAYNTSQIRGDASHAHAADVHWVGDLALRCNVDVQSPAGELIFELCKGGRQFRCRLNVATGRATLSISGQDMAQFQPTATTSVRGPGRHEIIFSNCDNELRLWVDGRVVYFDAPTSYEDLGNSSPDATDLSPVGIATVGAKASIAHLRIFRDIYYGAVRGPGTPSENGDVQYSPNRALPSAGRADSGLPYVDFPLKADQFFTLGDNSARSKDGRLWGADNYWVPRELLIGKALFIYWPHSWNRIPYVNVPFPFFPNVGRMGFVR